MRAPGACVPARTTTEVAAVASCEHTTQSGWVGGWVNEGAQNRRRTPSRKYRIGQKKVWCGASSRGWGFSAHTAVTLVGGILETPVYRVKSARGTHVK